MKRTVLLLASITAGLMLAGFVALGVPNEQARAAFPGVNGKIAFVRDPDGFRGKADTEIYTIWFDGNNLKRLTNNSRVDSAPAWSPSGKKIIFSGGSGGISNDLYTMNADGSHKRLITNERSIKGPSGSDVNPSVSPNGLQIVFDRLHWVNPDSHSAGLESDIYKIGTNGKNLTPLTKNDWGEGSPAWSPNGNKIAYDDTYPWDDPLIAVMNPDGSGRRFLCNSGATEPDWSPDGSQIVAQRDGSIFKFNLDEILGNGCDGLEPTILTSSRSYDPAFSPGGGKIVFSSRRDGDYDLYIMDTDGTNVEQITNNPGDDTLPDWQPVQ